MQNFGSLAEEQVNPLRMTGKDEMMFISTIQSYWHLLYQLAYIVFVMIFKRGVNSGF